MTIGSLFSGIGGLELGLEWAGLGPVKWQVEIDPFCRQVLAKHWPEAERHEDVRTAGRATLDPVELICGGFPCQDVSSAGPRTGLAGSRSGLWREFARVVNDLRPQWVVVENVTSGAQKWVDPVVRELEQLRYACLPIPLSAYDVGAPHRRRRIFIVAADSDGDQVHVAARRRSGEAHWQGEAVDRLAGDARFTANGDGKRLEARPEGHAQAQERSHATTGAWWVHEPDVARVVHGRAGGVDKHRRRALGNTVVPQCAEVIGWVIRELAGDTGGGRDE